MLRRRSHRSDSTGKVTGQVLFNALLRMRPPLVPRAGSTADAVVFDSVVFDDIVFERGVVNAIVFDGVILDAFVFDAAQGLTASSAAGDCSNCYRMGLTCSLDVAAADRPIARTHKGLRNS